MDFVVDGLLLSHDPSARPPTSTPPASPLRRARPPSWHMWLSSRVGAAEAALATVFVGGAALAASPRGKSATMREDDEEVLPPLENEEPSSSIDSTLAEAWGAVRRAAAAAMASFDDVGVAGREEQDREESRDRSDSEEEKREGHELEEGGIPERGQERYTENTEKKEDSALSDPDRREQQLTKCHVSVRGNEGSQEAVDVEQGVIDVNAKLSNLSLRNTDHDGERSCGGVKEHDDTEIEYSEITASSSLGDGMSRQQSHLRWIEDVSDMSENNIPEEREKEFLANPEVDREALHGVELSIPVRAPEDCEPSVLTERADLQVSTASKRSATHDEENSARLTELRKQFDVMFEQNGGAECVTRVKQIGDDALIGMKDSSMMDERVMSELVDAKLVLDDALRRLDSAVRSKVDEECPEYADAASAADGVIAGTKENLGGSVSEGRASDLVNDGSKLLAVFATKICASVLHCVETTTGNGTWSERVEKVAEIAMLGVSQLRTVSQKFAHAISHVQRCGLDSEKEAWPLEMQKLNEAAIGHVLQCVALAIAALQVEAAERAYMSTANATGK